LVGVQAEGEKDKVIQYPENHDENTKEVKNQTNGKNEPKNGTSVEKEDPKSSNSIPFPSASDPTVEVENEDENLQQYGRGHRPRKQKGAYRDINEGLTAAIAHCEVEGEDKKPPLEATDDVDKGFSKSLPDFALVGSIGPDPRTLDEVLRGPDAKHWQEALEYEISQLEKLETWEVIDLPHGHTAIPFSEVLKVKRGPDGEVQSYRVRIVAGGHRQVEGVNYTETFSAAANMPTVRVVLANTAHQDWEIEHVDVKSAYLNALLKETIYMKPPRGVLKPGQEGKVLRLKKGLYGLKPAGRGWYLKMSRVFLKELGFERSAIDHSVFYR